MNFCPRTVRVSPILLLLVLPLFGGCAVTPSPRNDGMDDSSRFEIKLAVLKNLIELQDQRVAPIIAAVSAYAIEDEVDGKQLAAAFAGHVPPVRADVVVDGASGHNFDKATGKPVETYAVRIRDISCNRATVGAGWNAATLVGLWYSYELRRVNGKWVLIHRAVVGTS